MSRPHVMTQADTKAIVAGLTALGDAFEAADDPRWFTVARAAAALEGIRLGVVAVDPLHQPRREVSHV